MASVDQMKPTTDGTDYDLSSLDLPTLISVAENSTSLSSSFLDVLKQRVTTKTIVIITYADGFKTSNPVEEERGYIRIENLQLASKFLKYFGQFISHIRIDHHNSLDDEMREIFHYINLYCFETMSR